jgi:hypothetical protein
MRNYRQKRKEQKSKAKYQKNGENEKCLDCGKPLTQRDLNYSDVVCQKCLNKPEKNFFKDVIPQVHIPDVDRERKELVMNVHYWNAVKKVSNYKTERIKAEEKSFKAYEGLLALCDHDSDMVQRLLYGKSKVQHDREQRERLDRKVKDAMKGINDYN